MKKTRRDLTEEEKTWARNLKAIYDAERQKRKFTQEEAGYAMDMTQGAISHFTNGTTPLNTDAIIKFARFLKCRPRDIAPSIGICFNDEFKDELANIEMAPETRGRVPLIGWTAAGGWCEAVDPYQPGDAERWLNCPVSHGPHTYALKVKGDSMTSPYPWQKTYPEGTIIFVDPDRTVTNGCRVIAKLPDCNNVTFKEYREDGGKFFLKPINPQYPTQEIVPGTKICGVVIGKFEDE
jgi:SOS-response transcriptional repressor LexA